MAELCGCERSIVATASFICGVVVGRGKDAPHPYLLQFARELTDPFTSCNTQESRPCTSPGQHIRANSVGGDVDELALRL